MDTARKSKRTTSEVTHAAPGTTLTFKSQEEVKFPLSPEDTLKHFAYLLTEYEKTEVMEYPVVYFVGSPNKVSGGEFNHGYDDEEGDYKIITGDHIGYRYEIKGFLGKGSFGICVKCFDHKHQETVALKVVKNKKKYYYQAGVELKIL